MSYFVRVTPTNGGVEIINLDDIVRFVPVDLSTSTYMVYVADRRRAIYRLTVSVLRSIILARQGTEDLEDIGRYD
jgi:hypothetical protein